MAGTTAREGPANLTAIRFSPPANPIINPNSNVPRLTGAHFATPETIPLTAAINETIRLIFG
jgi:hypothetical protein